MKFLIDFKWQFLKWVLSLSQCLRTDWSFCLRYFFRKHDLRESDMQRASYEPQAFEELLILSDLGAFPLLSKLSLQISGGNLSGCTSLHKGFAGEILIYLKSFVSGFTRIFTLAEEPSAAEPFAVFIRGMHRPYCLRPCCLPFGLNLTFQSNLR